MNYQKRKLKKQSYSQLQQQKKEVTRSNFNQRDKRPILRKLQDTEERNWGSYKSVEAYIPCSWIERINIIKMSILPKAIYTFNAIPIKKLVAYFNDLVQILHKFTWHLKDLK